MVQNDLAEKFEIFKMNQMVQFCKTIYEKIFVLCFGYIEQ